MALICTTTLFLALTAVQDPQNGPAGAARPEDPPAAAPTLAPAASGPIHLARLLPENTWGAVSFGPFSEDDAELRETGLWKLLGDLPVPLQMQQQLPRLLGRLSAETGLGEDALYGLVRCGWTVAVVPGKEVPLPAPHWLLAAEVGDTVQPALQEWFASLPARGDAEASVRGEDWDGLGVWRLDVPGTVGFFWTVRDGLLFASDDEAVLRGAIDRVLVGAGAVGLGESSGLERHYSYEAYVEDLARTGTTPENPLFAWWIDPSPWFDHIVRSVPIEQRAAVERVVDGLQVNSIRAVGYTAHAWSGLLHDHLRVVWREPRTGLLAAFTPAVGAIPADLARTVPDDAVSFSVTHVALRTLWSEALALAGLYDENLPTTARGTLRRFEEAGRFSIERDVFDNLSNRFVSMQVPGTDGEIASVTLLRVDDGSVLDGVVSSALGLAPETRDGMQVYDLGGAVLGIASDRIMVSADPVALDVVARHLNRDGAAPNETVERLLSELPQGTIGVAWSDVVALASGILGQVETAVEQAGGGAGGGLVPSLDGLRAAIDRSAGLLGEMRSTLAVDTSGVSFRTHSPSGNLIGLALVGGAWFAGQDPAALGLDTDLQAVREAQDEVFSARLLELVGWMESAQASPVADLAQLEVVAGLAPGTIGDVVDGGRVLERDGYRWMLLQPERRDGRFGIVAWPARSQPGVVYAITQDGVPMGNELLAGTGGIETFVLQDLFLGGTFDGPPTPGWKPLTTRTQLDAPEAVGQRATTDRDRELYDRILRTEEGEKVLDAAELVALLDYDDPRIVARAAYAVGELRVEQGVESLCRLMTERKEVAVRRQAMRSLVKLRSKASIETSMAALGDVDETVRALAARNLGRLGATEARDALLSLLASQPGDGEQGHDRLDALLALTDFGDPQILVAMALSAPQPEGELEKALTYAFQTLSEKLGEGEASELIAVLDHDSLMLRRYALQRLATLAVPSTAKALERRLAAEGPELQPLVQVALASVRPEAAGGGGSPTVAERVAAVWQRTQRTWEDLDGTQRNMVLGGGAGIGLLGMVAIWWARRRRRRRTADHLAAMVAPSEEQDAYDDVYEDEDYDEGYEDEAYDEYGDEGEYADEEYDDAYDDAARSGR